MAQQQSPNFTFDDLNMTIQQSTKQESPFLACLRAKNEDLQSRTQHTVSTLGTSAFEDSTEDFDCDEEESIASLDIFDCNPLDAFTLNDDVVESDLLAIDTALRISGEHIDDDDISELHDSHSTVLYDDFDDILPEEEPETVDFNDSMISLNDAFEKLNQCMMRTAQSRKLVRDFTEKDTAYATNGVECQENFLEEAGDDIDQEGHAPSYHNESFHVLPKHAGGLQFISDDAEQRTMRSTRSTNSLGRMQRGHDSISSLNSVGSRSSSKGRRTYRKKSRRALKKGNLTRTGVAPSLLALLS